MKLRCEHFRVKGRVDLRNQKDATNSVPHATAREPGAADRWRDRWNADGTTRPQSFVVGRDNLELCNGVIWNSNEMCSIQRELTIY